MGRRAGGTRRDFLKLAGVAAASAAAPRARGASAKRICIVVDGADAAAGSGPVRRAAQQLSKALAAKGIQAEVVTSLGDAVGGGFVVVAARSQSKLAQGFRPGSAGGSGQKPTGEESLRMSPGQVGRTPALLVEATDALGFVYALLELAERVEYGADVRGALHLAEPTGRAAGKRSAQRGAVFLLRAGRQAVVLRQGFLGRVSGHAGGEPLQPVLLCVRAGVRLSTRSDG